MRARWGSRLALVLLAVMTAAGCAVFHPGTLNFRVDDRLHFVSPADRSTVTAPVRLHWTMRDFAVRRPGSAPPSSAAGYFAVFVDRAPIKPGQTLKAVASGDPLCQQRQGCPDRAYLALHQVYTTDRSSITVPEVHALSTSNSDVQTHTFTVVLLDTAGRRIGESAWQTDLRIPRKVTA
jgi:hypothetical protein